MIIENAVQEAQIIPPEPAPAQLATVHAVYTDGVALQFDGEESPRTGKHYRVNTSCTFKAGMLVYVVKISGSYLVVCPVGTPS